MALKKELCPNTSLIEMSAKNNDHHEQKPLSQSYTPLRKESNLHTMYVLLFWGLMKQTYCCFRVLDTY